MKLTYTILLSTALSLSSISSGFCMDLAQQQVDGEETARETARKKTLDDETARVSLSLPTDMKVLVLKATTNEKVSEESIKLRFVCKDFNNIIPKICTSIVMDAECYRNSKLPNCLKSYDWIQSIELVCDFGNASFYNFYHNIIREGLQNKPNLKIFKNTGAFGVSAWFYTVDSEGHRQNIRQSSEFTTAETLAQFLALPHWQSLKNLDEFIITGIPDGDRIWGAFMERFLTPQNFPNLKKFECMGKLDSRFPVPKSASSDDA